MDNLFLLLKDFFVRAELLGVKCFFKRDKMDDYIKAYCEFLKEFTINEVEDALEILLESETEFPSAIQIKKVICENQKKKKCYSLAQRNYYALPAVGVPCPDHIKEEMRALTKKLEMQRIFREEEQRKKSAMNFIEWHYTEEELKILAEQKKKIKRSAN